MRFRRWPRGWGPPTGSFTLNSGSPQVDGLVAWWPMLGPGVGWGLGAYDLSGYGTIASWSAGDGAWVVDGERGIAPYFDGDDDLVISNHPQLQETPWNQWAMSAWIYPTDASDGNQNVIRKGGGGAGGYMFRLANATGNITSAMQFDAGFQSRASVPALDGVWQHVVLLYDGADTKHYLDGRQVGSWDDSGKTIEFSTAGIRLGSNAGAGEFYDGRMSDVRLYNRVGDPAAFARQMWAPETRYDLYRPCARRSFMAAAAPPGDAMPMAMGHYRRRRAV